MSRQRYRPTNAVTLPPQGPANMVVDSESASQWEKDWRDSLTKQVEKSAEQHVQGAIIQERILNRLDGHDEQLKAHGEAIKALQEQPSQIRANTRATITGYGGMAIMVGSLLISLLSFLVASGLHITFGR